MTEFWSEALRREFPDMHIRHIMFNNASEIEDIDIDHLRSFAFQMAQIPTRSILHDHDYFEVSVEAFIFAI